MTVEVAIKLIESFGFPIASSIVLAFAIYRLMTWVIQKADLQHEEYRKDIKTLFDKYESLGMEFSKSVGETTNTFKEEMRKRDERYEKFDGLFNRILDHVKTNDEKLDMIVTHVVPRQKKK